MPPDTCSHRQMRKSERDSRTSYGVGRGTTRRCGTRCRQLAWGGSAYGGGGIGSYSSEVPQRVWIPVDCWVLAGTMTCADGLLWTGCHWMACKRSAVRARLAPLVRSEIRTDRTGSTAASTATAAGWAAVRVFGWAFSPAAGCWTDVGFQLLNRRWPACGLGIHRLIGAVTLAPGHDPALLEGHFRP